MFRRQLAQEAGVRAAGERGEPAAVPREAVRVLPVEVPWEREDAQRRLLLAARALLRARQPRLVLHVGAGPQRAREDAAPRQDGEGGQRRRADRITFICNY